ncbi:MAG: dienelactone hydrolase family protein [Gallionella sp.]|nr:dienelactone hydrolase family protein [Gallionella sp.]
MRIWLLPMVLVLVGCASPAQNISQHAAHLGYERQLVTGTEFQHVVYIKQGRAPESSILHVYLDGDGSPWLSRNQVASDPTPHVPLVLDLMAQDPVSSVYLGRPCYLGLSDGPSCKPRFWTSARYSQKVVDSMTAALNKLSVSYTGLVLIGYSGGGTLAMLMAENLPKTEAVITVAANLDTERWAAMHHQPALSESLNPAKRDALPSTIRQLHIAGAEDSNVPPALIQKAITQQNQAHFTMYAGHDHACCWRAVWREVLGSLSAD